MRGSTIPSPRSSAPGPRLREGGNPVEFRSTGTAFATLPSLGRGRVHARLTFAGVGAIAALAGAAAWWATRVPREPSIPTPSISAGAIWAAAFKDTRGASHSLGEFQGQVVVINFWATWCA